MFADNMTVLAQFNPVRIRPDLNRSADGACGHRVAVVVEAHQAGLGHRGRYGMEPVKPPGIAHQARPLRLEDLPDRLLALFRMTVRPGMGNAFVEQPGVQFVVARHPQPWAEEPLAHQANLVLDLSLLPARCRRAGSRFDQIVAAHLQKAPVIGALAADMDRIDRRLHVVVDAACAGALEEGEPLVWHSTCYASGTLASLARSWASNT